MKSLVIFDQVKVTERPDSDVSAPCPAFSPKAIAGERMTGLTDKSVAELEALAVDLRAQLARDSHYSPIEQIALSDVEWEIEKRRWRKDSPRH